MNGVTWSVETSDPRCPRCGGKLHVLLRVPPDLARWPAGSLSEGTMRLVPLCPHCDKEEPSAQGLLAFFVVHTAIDDENVADFAALVSEWVHHLPPPQRVDPVAFERDIAAWRRGDFDDSEPFEEPVAENDDEPLF